MFFLLRNDAEAQNVVGTCKCDVADDSHLASLINDKCRIFGLRDVKKCSLYTLLPRSPRFIQSRTIGTWKNCELREREVFCLYTLYNYRLSSRFVFMCPRRHLSAVETASLLEVAPTTSAKNSTKNMRLLLLIYSFQSRSAF